MPVCFFCGKDLELTGRVMKNDTCPSCKGDLHACVQCRFHDPAYHNECVEPKSEMVRDRDKSNSCGYFEIGAKKVSGEYENGRDKARNALDDLFKK